LAEDLPVKRLSYSSSEIQSKDFCVRRQKILDALNWLVQFNPLYHNVIIDNDRVMALPIDGLITSFKKNNYKKMTITQILEILT